MKKKKDKPTLFDEAAKGEAWKPSPEENLRLCILHLVTFGGSNLEELAEGTGLDVDLIDRYMVGQESVSRRLVERFCKIAGTTLPRVELVLPSLHWTFRLIAAKERAPLAELEREGHIEREAMQFALSVFDNVLREVTEGIPDPLGRGEDCAPALGARLCEAMAQAFANLAGEAFRQGARTGLRLAGAPPLPTDEAEKEDEGADLN